jgi:putative cell wall-binding protein
MGGEVTEKELDKLRDSGMTVYRRSGEQRWEKDGGAIEAPSEIKPSQGGSN